MVAVVAVVIVEAIEVVAIVEVIGLVADGVVAAEVAEVDARTATTRRPLTSIVRMISPHCLDKLTLTHAGLENKNIQFCRAFTLFQLQKVVP